MSETSTGLAAGFYWIRIGDNPPEVAHFHIGQWLLCGRDAPWDDEGVEVLSARLVFRDLRLVEGGRSG